MQGLAVHFKLTSYWSHVQAALVGMNATELILSPTTASLKGCMVEQLIALLSCNSKIVGSNPSLGFYCIAFACSPHACVGSFRVAYSTLDPQSKDLVFTSLRDDRTIQITKIYEYLRPPLKTLITANFISRKTKHKTIFPLLRLNPIGVSKNHRRSSTGCFTNVNK